MERISEELGRREFLKRAAQTAMVKRAPLGAQ